jgi:hypothetical protein
VPAATTTGGLLLLTDGQDPLGSPPSGAWLTDHRAELERLFLVGGVLA